MKQSIINYINNKPTNELYLFQGTMCKLKNKNKLPYDKAYSYFKQANNLYLERQLEQFK